jgi:hypothetical protein
MLDLTKLQYHTGYNTFKNNAVYTGSYSISGSTVGGTNIRQFNVTLARQPDIMDVIFSGASDTAFEGTYGDADPRPDSGWFKRGAVWVRGDNGGAGYVNYPTPWEVYTSLSGLTLTVTLLYSQQFSDGLSLTPATLSYKIVDYSVF